MAQIFWTEDNIQYELKSVRYSFRPRLGSGSCSETFKNTTTQKRMETEAQTLEERRTQVSNCSNTDVMK